MMGSDIPPYTVSTVELDRTDFEDLDFMEWYPFRQAIRLFWLQDAEESEAKAGRHRTISDIRINYRPILRRSALLVNPLEL